MLRAECAHSRAGFTLAELLLVIVLGALVLGLVASMGNGLRRQLAAWSSRVASAEQLRGAAAILPLDLRALSVSAGDIRAGEARDSSLEIRATVASAIVCAAGAGEVQLAPYAGPAGQSSALVQAGDTMWVLTDTDSTESWRAIPATSVREAPAGCAVLDATAAGATRVFETSRIVSAGIAAEHLPYVRPGAAVRVTRPIRYSVYRASDSRWYFGIRTWSSAAAQFATVQPVSGPYHRSARSGTAFHYFDSTGVEVPSGAADTWRITRVEAALVADVPAGQASHVDDSLTLVVSPRNRR